METHIDNLIFEAVVQTAKVWRDQPDSRPEIEEFVRSQEFTLLTEFIGWEVDPEEALARWQAGKLEGLDFRAPYRRRKTS